MGFYNTWRKGGPPQNHYAIALGVLLQGMGQWLPGHNRRNPQVEVRMISNLSRVYHLPSARGWRRWIRRLSLF